jgi:hypothetical protein
MGQEAAVDAWISGDQLTIAMDGQAVKLHRS